MHVPEGSHSTERNEQGGRSFTCAPGPIVGGGVSKTLARDVDPGWGSPVLLGGDISGGTAAAFFGGCPCCR
jgi:hypothetical protein